MHLLCTDYDGTLNKHNIFSKKHINRTINKIMKFREKGNLFCIATARDCTYIQNFCKKNFLVCDYIIGSNGAQIIENDSSIYSSYIDNNKVKSIMKFLESENKLVIGIDTNKGLILEINYLNTLKNFKLSYLSKLVTNCSYIVNNSIRNNYNTYQIVVMTPKKYINKTLKSLNNSLPKTLKAVYNEDELIGIVNQECDKASAINIIRKKRKIDKKDVFTIGNYYNDYSMIKEFNGYIVNSSPVYLKEKGYKVVSNIDEIIDILIEK
jgi:HAD superfamily hydrolase (TIGR01484 family)